MTKKHVEAQTQPALKTFEDFEVYRDLQSQYDQLGRERARLEQRSAEIRELLSRGDAPSVKSKVLDLIQAITGRQKTEVVGIDIEALTAELREAEDRLATLPKAFAFLNQEMRRQRSVLSQAICLECQPGDREEVFGIAQDLLTFAQKCTRRLRTLQNLGDSGVSYSGLLEPFDLQRFDVDSPESWVSQRLREMVTYSGRALAGWEDPLIANQPKPEDPMQVVLEGTMSGPDGHHHRGDIIRTPYWRHLVKTKQARPVSIEALRRKLDRQAVA